MSYKEFDNYDDYINVEMQGGSHIDECLTEKEFNDLKKGDLNNE